MTKQVLDDVERVLDPGPPLRQRALHRLGPIPQVFGQCLDDAALDRDVPVDIAVLKFGPLVRRGIAGIGEDSLRPCSRAAVWLMSASLAAVPVTVCTTPEATS